MKVGKKGRNEGREEGKKEGRKEGRKEGGKKEGLIISWFYQVLISMELINFFRPDTL